MGTITSTRLVHTEEWTPENFNRRRRDVHREGGCITMSAPVGNGNYAVTVSLPA